MASHPDNLPADPGLARWFSDEVQPHERDLRSWLRSRYPDARDVDDVVQESYVRLIQAKQNTPVACARAYLFATARNVALALFRRPRIFSAQPLHDPAVLSVVQEGPAVGELVSQEQESALLFEAIDALPGRCREIFILRKLHGASQREIAQRLGLSERTVEAQVARGAKRVVQWLRRRGVTAAGAGKDARG